MAKQPGYVGAVWVTRGAGNEVLSEDVTLTDDAGTLAHGNVIVDGVYADDACMIPINRAWWCSPAGALTVLGFGSGTVYVNYHYWTVVDTASGTPDGAETNVIFMAGGFIEWSNSQTAQMHEDGDFQTLIANGGWMTYVPGLCRWEASGGRYWVNDGLPPDLATLGMLMLIKLYAIDSDQPTGVQTQKDVKGDEGESDSGHRWEGWAHHSTFDFSAAPDKLHDAPVSFSGQGPLWFVKG